MRKKLIVYVSIGIFAVGVSLLLFFNKQDADNGEEIAPVPDTAAMGTEIETETEPTEGTDIPESSENDANMPDIEEDMIINFDDVFGVFEIPSHISREVVVGEYLENFPVELQEILLHLCDGIKDGNDNDWQKYEADCEIITLETCGDIPFEDILSAAEIYSNIDKRSMQIVDIDRDGTDEYVIWDSIGRGQLSCIYVVKYVDEKWRLIGGGNARYSTDICRLLEYNDRYYLLVGEKLSYWCDEAEMPNGKYWEYWDSAPWQADVWDLLKIEKETTGYTPYELYSYSQDDSVDYLSDMNLISLADNCAEEENFEIQYWSINGKVFWLKYRWKQEYAGEKYFYVAATVDEESDDMLLTVLCEKENEKVIVKVYYLAANYNIQFEKR